MKTLYPDQEKIIHDTREELKKGVKRTIIMAPCSFGKTFVSSEIIRMFNVKRPSKMALFLCDRIALCEQTAREFSKLGHRVAVLQQGWRGDTSPNVLVASVQSIEKAPKLPEVDLILHDEAHCLRAYIVRLMTEYNNVPIIGLTATPWSRGLGASGYYETIVKGPTVTELIDNKRLAPSDVWCPSAPDLTAIGAKSGEYNQKELGLVTAKRVGEVVETWFDIAQNKQTMISAVNCADSINIIDRLVSMGIKAVHVDYKTTIQAMYGDGGIIEKYKANEIQVLSSVFKLSIGIDLPNCECTVAAAPTKSLIREIQFRGRGIRVHPGKEDCTHIDMAGNIERLCDITDVLPDELDRGDKPAASSGEYEKREATRCKNVIDSRLCNELKNGNRTCPKCGHTPTPNPDIEYIDGKLVNKNKTQGASKAFKKSFARQLKQYGEDKNYKFSWAYLKYKDKFKEEPECKIWKMTNETPGVEVLNYIRYQQIKYAKSKIRDK